MSSPHSTEVRFLRLFQQYFLGADISGKPGSGFINLLRMKKRHFDSFERGFHREMGKAIANALKEGGRDMPERDKLRADIFNKLDEFFSRYFSESGSVYFCNARKWQPVFERLRAPERDVSLVWKTSGLYYVKSDTLVRSMSVTPKGAPLPFWMDAADLPPKQNNERRDFLFEYAGAAKVDGRDAARLKVSQAVNGYKTKFADIAGEINKNPKLPSGVSEDNVREAVAAFRRQTDADFFIHKNARKFLREQLDMFLFHYLVGDEEKTDFGPVRLAEIRALQNIALLVIDFVAEFEDELRRVWKKSKFVRGVKFEEDLQSRDNPRRHRGANYVVTADKIPSDLLRKAAKHSGAKAQVDEWRKLGIVRSDFSVRDFPTGAGEKPAPKKKNGNGKNGDSRFLPLDTRHFKDLELEILAALAATAGGLDAALDGELIHSENWQALNVLQSKHAGRVKCVFIDPPFNLEGSDQFAYRTNYKDSCWATMLENRVALARKLIAEDGGIFVRCDRNGDWIVRCVMDEVFGADNFLNCIAVGKSAKITESITRYHSAYDVLFFYAKGEGHDFKAHEVKRNNRQWQPMHLGGVRWSPIPEQFVKMFSPKNIKKENGRYKTRARIILGKEALPPEGRHWAMSQEAIFKAEKLNPPEIRSGENGEPLSLQGETQKITDNWTDKVGYARTWGFSTENHENVLLRAISSIPGVREEFVCDFFAGSGTTLAVAHKLGRKWIGVEMGDHFHSVVLRRMKSVLAGDQTGVSAEKDVQYKGGGAFKYYALEQYEESLAKTRRVDDPAQDFQDSAYIFHKDEKMTWAAEVKDKKIGFFPEKLYEDLDLAETLSLARGLPIKEKTADKVVLSDGETEEIFPLNLRKAGEKEKARLLSVLKPYLWW